MSMTSRTLIATALLALSGAAFAQAAAPAGAASTPRVDQRQENQEKRIEQGKASGELTPRETRRLNREQNVIDKAEAHAKADGTVSAAERRRLHKMQQRASRDIARQKHDANTAAPGPKN
jgi:tellurite resistance protein